MLTIIKDKDQGISFTYSSDKSIENGNSSSDFINELAITVDSVLRQAEHTITGINPSEALDIMYNCIKKYNYHEVQEVQKAPSQQVTADQKKMSFNYFVQYADYIVPGIIREIEEKYGKERLARCVNKGDMAASAHEKILDCAWLYMSARDQQNEELMFACAKQLIAARSNKILIESFIEEVPN